MPKKNRSTDGIDVEHTIGGGNGDAGGNPDAESPDEDIEEHSFSTKHGAPSTDWTVKQKRKASSIGGVTAGKMKKLAKEAERPRCIGHAARDDLLAVINQFVSQVCGALEVYMLLVRLSV